MIILFPVVLTLVFGTAFSAIGSGQPTYRIGVVNLDTSSLGSEWSERFMSNLSATQILQVHTYQDEVSANAELRQGKLQAVLVIPAGFGSSCQSFIDHPSDPAQWIIATVALSLDKGSVFATQAIPPMVQEAFASTLGATQTPALP